MVESHTKNPSRSRHDSYIYLDAMLSNPIHTVAALKTFPLIRILRFDNNIWFANVAYWQSEVKSFITADTKVIILDLSPVNWIDYISMAKIQTLVTGAVPKYFFCNVKGALRDSFKLVGLTTPFYYSIDDAVTDALLWVVTAEKLE